MKVKNLYDFTLTVGMRNSNTADKYSMNIYKWVYNCIYISKYITYVSSQATRRITVAL